MWSSSSRSRVHVLLPALLVVALTTFFHRQFLSGEALIYADDTAQLQYPRYRILCDTLQGEHAFPLWQTLLYGGSPFHANPENPTLYPPAIVLASLFSPVWTINLMIVLHLAFAGLGMYLLILSLWRRIAERRPGASESAEAVGAGGACVGATIFALNLFTRLNHTDYVAYGAAIALGPWILFAAEAMLHGARPRRAAGWLALLLALEVFTGGLYVIPYTLLALALWISFLGIVAGREVRKRALLYGALAATLAGLVVMAKVLPHYEWVSTTNRAAPLSYMEARASAPWIEWGVTWKRVSWATGGGLALLPVLLALPLWREGVVRLLFGGMVFFFLAYVGGPVHRFLWEWVPWFDQVRGLLRAWTGVNLFFPIAAGLGTCWLLARAWSPSRRHLPVWLGALVAILLAPRLAYSYRIDKVMRNPDRFSDLVVRYTQWPEAQRLCGSDWRAVFFDKNVPDGRCEQFITTALGVETVAGYLGHVWPVPLENYVYGPASARLDPESRKRRLGTLSVRWLVLEDAEHPAGPRAGEVIPAGIDGTTVAENPHARPRAIVPAAVVGVIGDAGDAVLAAILDDPRFPIADASVISFDADAPPARDEARALDALVVVARDGQSADDARRACGDLAARAIVLHDDLGDEDRAQLDGLMQLVADTTAGRLAEPARFTRVSSRVVRVELERSAKAAGRRFVVVSEPWSWYPGWKGRSAEDEALVFRRADAIGTAVLAPENSGELTATYAPDSVRLGAWIGALGVVLSLCAIAWPRAKSSVGS